MRRHSRQISLLADVSASAKIYIRLPYLSEIMRRLIIEFSKDEFSGIDEPVPFHNIRTLEILQLLRLQKEEFAAICRIEPEDATSEFDDLMAKAGLVDGNTSEAQVLEREESGAYIVFVRHNPVPIGLSISPLGAEGGYLISSEIREGKVKMTYLGTVKQIKSILERLQQYGLRYRILSLTDAKFSLNSPLNLLTDKQRRVLTTAYKLGYYNLPRKINSEQLAKKLNLHKSAFATHRRKAELRLIAQILKEQNPPK